MTNDWQERKGLIVVLGAVSAAVWGYNAYAVANATGARPDIASAPAAIESSVPPHYADPGRDPFLPPPHVDLSPLTLDTIGYSSPLLTHAEGVGQWVEGTPEPFSALEEPPDFLSGESPSHQPGLGPPPFTFAGVVGRTAQLPDPSGESVSVRVGETIDGFRVTRVDPDAVTLADGARTYTLGLFPSVSLP